MIVSPGCFDRFTRLARSFYLGEMTILSGVSDNYKQTIELEAMCYMTRSTAYRRLKEWMCEGRMKKMLGIDAYAPVSGNFGVSRVE